MLKLYRDLERLGNELIGRVGRLIWSRIGVSLGCRFSVYMVHEIVPDQVVKWRWISETRTPNFVKPGTLNSVASKDGISVPMGRCRSSTVCCFVSDATKSF